jgi:hypothetical protein
MAVLAVSLAASNCNRRAKTFLAENHVNARAMTAWTYGGKKIRTNSCELALARKCVRRNGYYAEERFAAIPRCPPFHRFPRNMPENVEIQPDGRHINM